MHIKFLAHGTGDPHRAVNYLLADKDHNGMLRSEVTVLRGNPRAVANVAASLDSVHRYTSAVIAWAPEDQPTNEEMDAVIHDFEQLAFAGLEKDEVSSAVIRHGDHLHVIVARVNLRTGKAINIAPPVWRKHFDHLRDHWNYKLGWGHPGDPARSRLHQANDDGRKAALSKQRRAEVMSAETGFSVGDVLEASGEEPSLKQIITDRLEYMVHGGVVHNRDDVIRALEEYGSINRKGRDYVSIKPWGEGKPIRFKGAMFQEDFVAQDFLARRRTLSPFTRANPNPGAAAKARRDLEEAILRRVRYYESTRDPAIDKTVALTADDSVVMEIPEDLLPELPSGDQSDDRNRNPVVEEIQRRYEAARGAVQQFIRSCFEAVSRFAAAERANRAAQQACLDAQRASLDAQSRSPDLDGGGASSAWAAGDESVSKKRSMDRTRPK